LEQTRTCDSLATDRVANPGDNQGSHAMYILVTGGAGNVGRTVIGHLQDHGHAVRVLDRVRPETDVEAIVGEITDAEVVARAVAGMDGVVHLAAIPAYRPEIPTRAFMETNVLGTSVLLEAAAEAGVRRVVFASSDSSLGFVFSPTPMMPQFLPVDENHPRNPRDPYGLSKLLGEELCRSATGRYGMDTVCLRFCWVWFEDTCAQWQQILKGDPAAFARGLWGYVDVRVARSCRLALEVPGQMGHTAMFITAADTFADIPTRELIERDFPGVTVTKDAYFHAPFRSLFDTSHAARAIGYEAAYSLRSGT
jgi:nucleoside-diphosphate-sugar epimerase